MEVEEYTARGTAQGGPAGAGGYCSPKALSAMFPNTHKEYEIRAMTRKRKDPLPCIRRGAKRPVTVVHPAVYSLYLQYEQGFISYGEVVEGARRGLVGARS